MTIEAHFLVLQPNAHSAVVPFVGPTMSIGSGPDAALRLTDPDVAPLHAEVRRTPEGFLLVRQAPPLWVNGRRVREELLRPSDLILLGRSALSFRPGPAPRSGSAHAGTDRALLICQRLYTLTHRLSSGDAPGSVTDQLLDDIVELTGADRGMLVLFEGETARIEKARTCTRGRFDVEEQQLSRTAMARILEERRPLLWSDTASDRDLAFAPSVQNAGVRSMIGAPITRGEELLGALQLSSTNRPDCFDQEALDLVTLYANQAALLLTSASRGRALAERSVRAESELALLRETLVLGSSSAMVGLRRDAQKVAGSDIPLLLWGETGTGKELVAREIHRLSPRSQGPFVPVHCGAIPEPLLESELFGHVRGAFTGALTDRVGQLRAAGGGTLFLDEIGEMPLAQQTKLLRVLEHRLVTPVGGDKSLPTDFRLICATNLDLQQQAAAGRFRQDLYFRVAGVTLHIPPLREREDDAVELAHAFLRRHTEALGRPAIRFSVEALTAIRAHRWAGNVRELEAAVRKGIVLSEADAISASDLGLRSPDAAAEGIRPLAQVRDQFLQGYVQSVVEKCGGSRAAAAEALQVSVRTIFKYLEEV
jgi:transcriptional regulator with GAF, ATPase, and Fis domain